MISPTDEGLGGVPPTRTPGGGRVGLAGVGLAVLLLVGCAFLLTWVGMGSYTVAETYGGLGGGWAQILVLVAVGVGVVVGGLLVVAARLLARATRARWLVLAGVTLALLAIAVGAHLGSEEHAAAAERAEHACDHPVGSALVSFAEGLEPSRLVRQNGQLALGRDDGTCQVLVNVAPEADVAAEISRVAAADGRSRSDDSWVSPDGVSMTFDTSYRPESMTVVELLGRRADP